MAFSKKVLSGILAVSLVLVVFVAFSLSTAWIIKPTPKVKPTPTPTIKPTPVPTPTLKPTPTPTPSPAPKTEILSINAAAFGPCKATGLTSPVIWSDTTQSVNYFAPVYLPSNAVITKVAFSVNDNNTVCSAQLSLMKQQLYDASSYLLCSVNSTDGYGTLRYNSVPTNGAVDNSQSAYFLQLVMPATRGSGFIYFAAAQITYTYYP